MAESMRTSTWRGGGRADALELAGLEYAEEFGLLARGDVGDLVEEEGAAVGELEAAYAVGAGVGKCALDVAEELGLEGSLGESAGIDGDERAMGAEGEAVESLGDDFLAGPVLAGDEDVGVRRADACDEVQHGAHGRGRRDKVRGAVLRGGYGFRPRAGRSGGGRDGAPAACAGC